MSRIYHKPAWWSKDNSNDCRSQFPYLARQISGPVAGCFGLGIDYVYEDDYNFIEWLSRFSIQNLSGEWLDKLGLIIGLPRPWKTVPIPIDTFEFDTVNGVLDPKKHGFSTDHNFIDPNTGVEYLTTEGGLLFDIYYTKGTLKISDEIYREYLIAAGLCKRKHSIIDVDSVVKLFVNSYRYTISFNENHPGDIDVKLSGVLQDYSDSLQDAFNAMFTTAPRVNVTVDAYFEEHYIQPKIQAIADEITGDNLTQVSYFYENQQIYFIVSLDPADADKQEELQKALDEEYSYMADLHVTVTIQDSLFKFDYKPPVLDGEYHGYSTDQDMTVSGEPVTTNDGGQLPNIYS